MRQGLRPGACRRLDITSILKVICARRQLSYGKTLDFNDNLLDVSETTSDLCLEHISSPGFTFYGKIYLQAPRPSDLQTIEKDVCKIMFPV